MAKFSICGRVMWDAVGVPGGMMDGVCIYARCVARFENCARAADESVLMRRREQCIDDDRRLRTLLKLASWGACNTRFAVQISDVER